MIVPITRKEKLLNAIATNGNVDFSPKTREELFLFKILGADVNTPTPITRKEILYQHIIDGTIPTFEPRTRLEKFIMVAAGVELELPVVLTREERWWAEISDSAYETITGAIVHFISKKARAVKSLIANISCTQDLNGYSYPWPAGGGDNLLNTQTASTATASNHGLDWSLTNNVFSYSGEPTQSYVSVTLASLGLPSLTLPAGSYKIYAFDKTGVFTPRLTNSSFASYLKEGRATTLTEEVTFDRIVSSALTAGEQISGSFKIMACDAAHTAPTSFSPYSNICPISGWSEVTVEQRGKNLFDPTTFSSRSNYYDVNDDGSVKIKASDSSGWTSVPIISLKAGTYTISINDYTSGNYQVETSEDNYTSPTHKRYDAAFTFTLTKDGGIKVKMGTGGATLPQTVKPILNIGYTAASYSPYSGDTYSITFPSEAGTVYGGTLDVTTGKLTVDRAMVDLGAKNWYPSTAAGRTRFRTSITDIERISSPNIVAPMLCSAYKTETANNTYTGKQGISLQQNAADVYVYDAQRESMTTADFKTAMSGVQLVYKLATPIVYDLTPTEVTTLLGDNTIWADTGDVTVTY